MKYRRLRIAWSATCGILCLLLIALWVRSYWWRESVWRIASSKVYTSLASDCGTLSFDRSDKRFWRDLYVQVVAERDRWHYRSATASKAIPGFGWRQAPGEILARIPYWVIWFGCLLLAVLPWMRSSFSLRTLLIVTTVMAVALALIVAIA